MFPQKCMELLQNEFFVQITDNMEDAILVIDNQSRILFINKAYEGLFGVAREELLGEKLNELAGGSNTNAYKTAMTGNRVTYEVERLRGTDIDSFGVSFPIYHHGEIIGSVSMFNASSKYLEMAAKLEKSIASRNENI